MQGFCQNVINTFAEVKQNSTYLAGLLLHAGRKTCASMARGLSVPVKRFYNFFEDATTNVTLIRTKLISLARELNPTEEFRVLVIDGTDLAKVFAKHIDHLSTDYDGVIRRVTQGLSIMVAGLVTSGNMVPLDFLFWHNKKKAAGKTVKKYAKKKSKTKKKADANYKTKVELAIELIAAYKDLVFFAYVAMDGAFASNSMIIFLETEKLKYSMRIARSRKVTINGIEAKLCEHPALKLVRNERSKTASGLYKANVCFFTIHKRKKRGGGWETIFLVSNMKLSAKGHVEAYNRRWTIDKSFRSMKQYLGLKDCQMLSGVQQTLHILSVFLAYALATAQKVAYKKKSVEEILGEWRSSKKIQNISGLID